MLHDLPPLHPSELFDERKVDLKEGEEKEEDEEEGEGQTSPSRSRHAPRLGSLTSLASGSSRRSRAMASLRRALSGRRRNQAYDWMRGLKAPDEHHRPLYDAPAFASDAPRALPAAGGCHWGSEVLVVPADEFAPWMSNARHSRGMPPLPRRLAEVLRGDTEGRAFLRVTRRRTEQEREALVQLARAVRRGHRRGHRVAPAPEG